jgi:ribose transport system ATP-binding protein
MSCRPPLLRLAGISKSFPGVQALRDVQFEVRAGEVHALLGENGAGKSTLIKLLAGIHSPDLGQIEINGKPVVLSDPRASQAAGIGIIHQELNLVPELNVSENLYLGRESSAWGWLKRREETQRAESLFARLGVSIPLHVPCRELSLAQQQLVEIAKAIAQEAQVLIMDEPTTTLTPWEVEHLFRLMRDLQAKGIGIVYVSHRLEEIEGIADRITILRDGRYLGTWPQKEITRDQIIESMVGRSIDQEFPQRAPKRGSVCLEVEGLSAGQAVKGVSFELHYGEVLGITGLVGAGRTELARLLFGAEKPSAGHVKLDGVMIRWQSPRQAIAAGIGFLTEDRKRQGLLLERGVQESFGLPSLSHFAWAGWLRQRLERQSFANFIDALKIKVPHPEVWATHLSGGNQQKVVLAKWLQTQAKVLIFDEPTRGIDVGAKQDIYRWIQQLADSGKAILLISSELPEVLGMSDRVLVMHQGRITGEIMNPSLDDQAEVMKYAIA